MSTAGDVKCQICNVAAFRYTCPKCNILYCSVDCYKAPVHLNCSEEFYKNCIAEEMSSAQTNLHEDMQKMYNILKRMREYDTGVQPMDLDVDGQVDSDDEPLPDSECDTEEKAEGNDEELEDDIASRLKGIDINNSDAVWSRLTSEEQFEFQKLIESGEIMKLVPDYKPWWSKDKNSKIVVISEKTAAENKKTELPEICNNIPKFTDICKKLPSPCLHYNLWNILSAYACVVRYFGGEHLTNPSEAVAHLMNLSAALKYGTNFEDAEDAIVSVEMEALTTKNTPIDTAAAVGGNLLVESREQLQQDAHKLMSTRDYKLAALSDILQLLLLAKQLVKNNNSEQAYFQKLFSICSGSVELNRSKLQQLSKKIEFLLSYVNRDESNLLE